MATLATTLNQTLNLPDDARLLILNADDFGMCHSINEATIQSITAGLAASCTIMGPCPWSLHAIHLLQQNPDIPFGIHLTAVSEAPYYRWSAMSPKHEVASLLDEDGYFYHENRIDELLHKAELAELEREFRTQIEWVLAKGLAPTHLDSHCHVHTRRESVFDMTLGLAREYGLGMRVGHPSFFERLQRMNLPSDHHPVVDSYAVPTADKLATYIKMLQDLPQGLSEWAIHPGIASAELKAMGPSWEVRQADLEFLLSAKARQVIKEEGIILIDYRPLQALWQAVH